MRLRQLGGAISPSGITEPKRGLRGEEGGSAQAEACGYSMAVMGR
jgi:hypothetical protein